MFQEISYFLQLWEFHFRSDWDCMLEISRRLVINDMFYERLSHVS